ncbi:MAG: cytochrome c oxidase subunit 3 [Candidatus Acidiferrales bacterium]
MPGATITPDIELIETHGPGRGGNGSGMHGGGGGGDRDPGAGKRRTPQRAYVTGITGALAGILMFFMALVSAYIVRKGISLDWQPTQLPRILWLNTAILLVSSGTIVAARSRLKKSDLAGFRKLWLLTTALGFAFLLGQLIAWRELVNQGVYLATNPSSSFFYVLTASHGLHLLGGVVALLFVALRHPRHLTESTAAEVTSIYWHFMDALWVFLLLLLTMGR